MHEVDRLKTELAHAVLTSNEYREYKRCERILMQNADLYRSVNAMRKQNFELQNNQDIYDMFEEGEHLKNQYEQIRTLSEVQEFLLAEVSLGRMIRDIYETIVRDLEFDTSFLRD